MTVIALRPAWLPSPADVGRLELVKWAAFVAMIADHIDFVLFGRQVPFLHALGVFAFPVFCLTFGLGLARTRDPGAVARRLLAPALVAQAAWLLVHQHPANVLFVFALCAFCAWCWRFGRVAHVAAWVAAVGLAAVAGEGGAFGVLLVAAGFFSGGWRSWWPVAVVGGAWCVLAPSVGAVLALLAVVAWPPGAPRLARLRGSLAWGYAGHLAALAALAVAGCC